MGLMGILLNGSGSFVERVTVDSNAGGGMIVAGAVLESAATQNGSFGIVATTIRDSTALQNLGDGIILAANAGVATGNGRHTSAPFKANANSSGRTPTTVCVWPPRTMSRPTAVESAASFPRQNPLLTITTG